LRTFRNEWCRRHRLAENGHRGLAPRAVKAKCAGAGRNSANSNGRHWRQKRSRTRQESRLTAAPHARAKHSSNGPLGQPNLDRLVIRTGLVAQALTAEGAIGLEIAENGQSQHSRRSFNRFHPTVGEPPLNALPSAVIKAL
jgi:hypothetical protein